MEDLLVPVTKILQRLKPMLLPILWCQMFQFPRITPSNNKGYLSKYLHYPTTVRSREDHHRRQVLRGMSRNIRGLQHILRTLRKLSEWLSLSRILHPDTWADIFRPLHRIMNPMERISDAVAVPCTWTINRPLIFLLALQCQSHPMRVTHWLAPTIFRWEILVERVLVEFSEEFGSELVSCRISVRGGRYLGMWTKWRLKCSPIWKSRDYWMGKVLLSSRGVRIRLPDYQITRWISWMNLSPWRRYWELVNLWGVQYSFRHASGVIIILRAAFKDCEISSLCNSAYIRATLNLGDLSFRITEWFEWQLISLNRVLRIALVATAWWPDSAIHVHHLVGLNLRKPNVRNTPEFKQRSPGVSTDGPKKSLSLLRLGTATRAQLKFLLISYKAKVCFFPKRASRECHRTPLVNIIESLKFSLEFG